MKESEIRPEALLRRYLELSEHDATTCFGNESRVSIPCVACGSPRVAQDFEKHGFAFSLCQDCGTLFQTPRPAQSAFEAFYQDSVSSNYWAEVFFPAVAEVRREKIFIPRVERLALMCKKQGLAVNRLIDVGAGYGIFLDEWRKRVPETQLVAVEPSASMAMECRTKGFEVVESSAEEIGVEYQNTADLVVCFEVLEHVYEPLGFLKSLMRLSKPGGYVFLSTLCVDGFDLQMLWDKSNQIFPPHHINFLSVAGFEKLFERAGLGSVSITTPGKLDVDIVINAFTKDEDLLRGQDFIKRVLSKEKTAKAFQNFISENCLSSHVWVIGKKQAQKV